MFLFASFEQNLRFKRCFNLRFPNDFKIKKKKEKKCTSFSNKMLCNLMAKALGCSIKSWVQT
jgi:hypothetical protein